MHILALSFPYHGIGKACPDFLELAKYEKFI